MKTIAEMRTERNALAANMQATAKLEAEGATLTDEQLDEFVANEKAFNALDAAIKRRETVDAQTARLAEVRPSPGSMQALDDAGPIAPGGPEAKRKFECVGEMVAAVYNQRAGLGSDQRLDWHDFKATENMSTGSAGGFMVPTEFRPELLKVDPAATPISAAAMHLPPGASPDAAVTLPALDQSTNQHGGVTVSRVGEAVASPDTSAALKQVTLTPKELTGSAGLTNRLIRNWSGSMGFMEGLLGSALMAAIEDECFSGSGAAQMQGILGSPAAYAVPRSVASAFNLADVANMAARMLSRGGAAFWLYNPLLLADLIQMKDGNNNLVFQQSIAPGSPSMLWGKPAYPYEFASAVGSKGDVALVQPSPYYLIKDGSGPYVDIGFINTDFTQGISRVKISIMNDGGPWLAAPFKLADGTTEVSPFVLLDVPAA